MVALLAECSKKVGSGHAVETWQLTRFLGKTPWRAYLSAQTPRELFKRFGARARKVRDFSPQSMRALRVRLKRDGTDAVFLNFLRLSGAQIEALRGLKVGALTVAGPAPRGCSFHRRGLAYLAMAPEFARLARRRRIHRGPVKNLLIAMGGTDSSGATAKLVRALAGRCTKMIKHVVQGPNFARPAQLKAALKAAKDPSFRLHRNLPSLASLMRRCDAAFTFGSNTSLELACLGTPTVLMHEAPHERRQAAFLARRGCGILLASPARAAAVLPRLDAPDFRNRCARAGARLVDGRGGQRLARDIRGLL